MSKLTKQFIENEVQLPASGQRFYRDDDVLGFAVRVTRKSKSYIFEKRVDGVNRRITIGKCSELTFNNALKKLSTLINFASDRFGNDDEPLIKINPVTRLSRNRSWHRTYARQGIIPDGKLKVWYRALHSLQHDGARDFFVFLLFTGMRFGETRKLKWCHVDFESEMLTVPHELTKSNREQRVRAKSGIQFTFHDLRRTFLTMGEKLDVPTYALKRLVNHSVSNDMTGRYLILDLDWLRSHMSRISDAFSELLGINALDTCDSQPINESMPTEVIQLRLQLNSDHFL
jgi:integrase